MNDSERLKREKLKEALWKVEMMEEDADYNELPEPMLSKGFRREIKRLNKMPLSSLKADKRKRWEKRLAVAVVVFITTILFNKPVKALVRSLVEVRNINYNGKISFEYDIKEGHNVPEYLEEKYIPGWIPEGYELDKMMWYERDVTLICSADYINSDGHVIYFVQNIVSKGKSRYAAGADFDVVFINDIEGKLYTGLELNGLDWNDESYAYSIDYSNLTEEEVVKIAESLVKYK